MFSEPAEHVSPAIASKFKTVEVRHASAILSKSFGKELAEIEDILLNFEFTTSQIFTPGGNMSVIAKRIHAQFDARGWAEKKFTVAVLIDGVERTADTHQVDHFKSRVAVETEWNSKDSVFDRDLKNFRLLFDMGVISVGIIITRASELQQLFEGLGYGLGAKYSESTTHMRKLVEELKAGTAGGCPVLVYGITEESYVKDEVPESLIRKQKEVYDKRQEKKATNDRSAESKRNSKGKKVRDDPSGPTVEIFE